MNGAGNDFILLDNRSGTYPLEKNTLARLCDRHRGIGADGVLAVESPSIAGMDFRMRYFNADGGEAEMCGNGARCFARFAARLMSPPPSRVSFETAAGPIVAVLDGDLVTLEMGMPSDHRALQSLEFASGRGEVDFLNTGVPHAVVFVERVGDVPVVEWGRALRNHEAFAPRGTNVNFVEVAADRLLIRTYERGVEDETLACGTGVCAAALLHARRTGAPSPVAVEVKGGDVLRVSFQQSGEGSFSDVRLTGPADFVFEGVVSL